MQCQKSDVGIDNIIILIVAEILKKKESSQGLVERNVVCSIHTVMTNSDRQMNEVLHCLDLRLKIRWQRMTQIEAILKIMIVNYLLVLYVLVVCMIVFLAIHRVVISDISRFS